MDDDPAARFLDAHHAHRLTITDGKITRDKVWCGGRWSEPLLQRTALAYR